MWTCPRHRCIWSLGERSGLEMWIWTNQGVPESHGCGDHPIGYVVWEGSLEQNPGGIVIFKAQTKETFIYFFWRRRRRQYHGS